MYQSRIDKELSFPDVPSLMEAREREPDNPALYDLEVIEEEPSEEP